MIYIPTIDQNLISPEKELSIFRKVSLFSHQKDIKKPLENPAENLVNKVEMSANKSK